jgi:hypothetical protein
MVYDGVRWCTMGWREGGEGKGGVRIERDCKGSGYSGSTLFLSSFDVVVILPFIETDDRHIVHDRCEDRIGSAIGAKTRSNSCRTCSRCGHGRRRHHSRHGTRPSILRAEWIELLKSLWTFYKAS